MEAEKSHKLLSATWRPRRAGSINSSPSPKAWETRAPTNVVSSSLRKAEDQCLSSDRQARDTHWHPLPLTENWTFWAWDWLERPTQFFDLCEWGLRSRVGTTSYREKNHRLWSQISPGLKYYYLKSLISCMTLSKSLIFLNFGFGFLIWKMEIIILIPKN